MRLMVIVLLGLLGGCTLLPTTPVSVTRPAQAESATFALNGRIAVEHDGERHSAGLRWTHRAQDDEVLLLGPLGQTGARIRRDVSGATLEEGGRLHRAADAEALMRQVLGWQLPLNGLHRWVLGLEDGALGEHDATGRLAVLHHDGWEVRYLRYDGDAKDSLPSSIELERGDLRVRLLIDEWDWSGQ